MAKQISYKTLANVGINGLNTQQNPASLESSWLTKAENIVLRESGRISFRKGLREKIYPADKPIGSIGEYKDGSITKIFAGSEDKIYEVGFDTPDTPWNTSYTTSSSTSDWQFVNFNRDLYALQSGSAPLRYTSGAWTTTITPPQGIAPFDPSCGTGHYGRMWVGGVSGTKDVVYYSDTLIGQNFNQGTIEVADKSQTTCEEEGHFWNSINTTCYSVPTYAGVIDLRGVWGYDEIVAIHPFAGKLAIFGKSNVVLYDNPGDPSEMSLNELIEGIGCVSRDSVVSVGDDLFFLSSTGVRSLSRTTQKSNLPLTDMCLNVKDTIIRNISQSPESKGVYIESEGIYTLTFTTLGVTYVFDLKHKTPNGTPRITTWQFNNGRHPVSFSYTESKGLLVGLKDGSIAAYEGYFDEVYIGEETIEYIEKGKTYVITLSVTGDWSSVGGPSSGAAVFPASTCRFTATWADDDETKYIWIGDGNGAGLNLGKVVADRPTYAYTGNFKTTWLDLGDSVYSSLLKKLKAVINGGPGTFVGVKWYKDFSSEPSKTSTFLLNPASTGFVSLWGDTTSLYGATKFTPKYGLKDYSIPLTGSAKHLQIEMSANTNGYVASLQDMTLLYKQGKIR